MNLTRSSAALLLIFLISGSINASLELIPENSFIVPGLNNPITQIKINDLQTGGLPEVLATDGEKVVLYFPSSDFIFFEKTLGLKGEIRTEYRIEFADINRDSVSDLAIMVFKASDVLDSIRLECFDGINNFASLGKITSEFMTVTGWDASLGLINLQALDINNDGFNELLLSYDETHIYMPPIEEMTAGFTHCIFSFPDSILWQSTAPYGPLVFLGSVGTDNLFYTLRYKSTIIHMDSHTSYNRDIWPRTINSNGSGVPMEFALGDDFEIIEREELYGGISGDFGCGSVYGDVLMIHGSKNLPDQPRSLCLYNFNSVDTLNLNWYFTAHEIDNLIEHPNFNNHCLALINNHLAMVRFSDGAIIQESADLPPGMISWTNPYPDGIPRLAVTDGNTVTLYNVDIATAADQPPAGQSLPESFSLAQNFPNPFNPSTEISFDLPRRSLVTIDIYNLLGRKVTNLISNELPAGTHRVYWNGKDQIGQDVATGIYFYRLTADVFTETKKMLLLK